MNREMQFDWVPLIGSWEESVLSWNEQVETAVRRCESLTALYATAEDNVHSRVGAVTPQAES